MCGVMTIMPVFRLNRHNTRLQRVTRRRNSAPVQSSRVYTTIDHQHDVVLTLYFFFALLCMPSIQNCTMMMMIHRDFLLFIFCRLYFSNAHSASFCVFPRATSKPHSKDTWFAHVVDGLGRLEKLLPRVTSTLRAFFHVRCKFRVLSPFSQSFPIRSIIIQRRPSRFCAQYKRN